MDSNVLLGKTIKSITIDGYGITMITTDGFVLEYSSSDGGYSQYDISKTEGEEAEAALAETERNTRHE